MDSSNPTVYKNEGCKHLYLLGGRGQQTMKTYLYTTSFIDVILQKYLSLLFF